jgi:hypothetical protein
MFVMDISTKAMEVEVFKTDVTLTGRANELKSLIEQSFQNCNVNFDLDDCDHILRVVHEGILHAEELIGFLKNNGCEAEILPDVVDTVSLEELTK